MHLVVDGFGADPGKLKDADLIYRFLDEYPAAIGMTKIIEPRVFTYHGKVPEDWGVSGFVIIAESHISIHTFPDHGHVNIDIFSCKEFDTEKSVLEVQKVFAMSTVRVWTMQRGLEYMNIKEAYNGMVRERIGVAPRIMSSDV